MADKPIYYSDKYYDDKYEYRLVALFRFQSIPLFANRDRGAAYSDKNRYLLLHTLVRPNAVPVLPEFSILNTRPARLFRVMQFFNTPLVVWKSKK